MKITLTKDQLQEKISLASRFTSSKLSSVSALQGILMRGEKGLIHLYSTDLTSSLHTTVKAELEEDFQIILEPRKVLEFLQFLNTGKVDLEIKEKQVIISQDKTKGNFPLIVSSDFPLPSSFQDKEQKIETAFFKKNLPLLLFAASSDETRPTLTGVSFVSSDEDLVLVATDGFRLSLIKTKKGGDIPSMLVPSEFLGEVVRNMKDEKEVGFSFSREEKMVMFRIGNTEFYSRLIDGEFPPYERVIPAETKTTVLVEKEEFLRNIKLISVFARDYSNVVVCEFKKDGLYVRPKKESNEENSAFQEVEMKGEEQKIAFNYKYALDLLNNIDTKSVQIEILRSDAPVVFKNPKDPNFLHIIMPVRIQE
jgi:DNA polymerase III subunit beta